MRAGAHRGRQDDGDREHEPLALRDSALRIAQRQKDCATQARSHTALAPDLALDIVLDRTLEL